MTRQRAFRSSLRFGLAFGAAAAAFSLLASCSVDYHEPWCGIQAQRGTTQCLYATYQQCLDTMSGLGGMCVENPKTVSERTAKPKAQ